MKLLVKFPSRERPQKLFDVLLKYKQFAKDPSKTHFLLSLDQDDPSVNDAFLQTLRSVHSNMDIHVGTSKNKIDAINRDMDKAPPFDILLLASDDMIPVVYGYDEVIRSKMQTHYPNTDGVLWFNDGYTGNRLNTLVICGKKYYERFGFIYNPRYKSFFCDNEFMEVANELRRQTYFSNVIIKHIHPANTSEVKSDNLYIRNNVYFREDENTYYSRKKYANDLSILICTMPSRRKMLQELVNELERQKQDVHLRVEILHDDRMTMTVGEKRQALIMKATGKYCCFVDDDDKVSEDYIASLLPGIEGNYDCMSLNGKYYSNGVYDKPFYHSIQYPDWTQDDDGYYRYPNHLNCMKTYIMRAIGFPKKSRGEDHSFSKDLYFSKLIRTEYNDYRDTQYHYYFQDKVDPSRSPEDVVRQQAGIPKPLAPRIHISQPHHPQNTLIASINNRIQRYKQTSGLKFAI